MLPFLAQPYFHIGSVNIMMFDMMVLLGVLIGYYTIKTQASRYELDRRVTFELLLIALLVGFPSAHILGVLWSTPELVWENPMTLLYLNEQLDSFGGFFGVTLGFLVYFKIRKKHIQPLFAYLDCATYALCSAWIFLRLGCAFAHDHPGRPSANFLAIQYPEWLYGGIPRHNLGLDEAVGTLFIFIILYRIDRKPHQYGVISATLLILYSILRFFLDYLRATDLVYSDERYVSLTIAQWGCLFLLFIGMGIAFKIWRNGKSGSYSSSRLCTKYNSYVENG